MKRKSLIKNTIYKWWVGILRKDVVKEIKRKYMELSKTRSSDTIKIKRWIS